MKPAFSTVACADWTFSQLAERGEHWGFPGIELRTFGSGSTASACDPALTAAAKVRALTRRMGTEVCSLGTSIRYDAIISPPVVGHLFDQETSIRETKGAIDLAVQLECPLVRVFGFELNGHETRKNGIARIARRLIQAADACRNNGVRLALENGGTFSRAVDIAEILDAVSSPLVCAAYCPAAARRAGESPADGINVLADHLALVKLKDFKGGAPCHLGEGEMRCRESVEALARAGYEGWVVYEYDRMWFPNAGDTSAALAHAAKTLFGWCGPHLAHPAAAR